MSGSRSSRGSTVTGSGPSARSAATTKRALLAGADALLFPIEWDEPFGLVMVEALAAGTPVIGFRRASVPEVIEDGRTGFVVDDVDGMAAAIRRLGEIDRADCRASGRGAVHRRPDGRRRRGDVPADARAGGDPVGGAIPVG